jgi:hypothetical protein
VQDKGEMVKSVVAIPGHMAKLFSTDQIRQFCSHLKLSGYQSKSRVERPLESSLLAKRIPIFMVELE